MPSQYCRHRDFKESGIRKALLLDKAELYSISKQGDFFLKGWDIMLPQKRLGIRNVLALENEHFHVFLIPRPQFFAQLDTGETLSVKIAYNGSEEPTLSKTKYVFWVHTIRNGL